MIFTASTTAPGSVPVLDVAHWRKPTSTARRVATSAPYATAAYITLTASTAVTLSGNLTFTVSPSATYSIAQYNTQGYWVTLATINGQYTAMVPGGLGANATEYFAVYSGGPLPSPNPNGCVGVQPDLTSRGGTAQTQAVGVQPTAGTYMYTGTYSETISRATPCAIPTASSSATVAISVTMAPGPGGNIYENSTETDTSSLETVTTKTSALVEATSAPAAQSFAELSETTTDESQNSVVTSYSPALTYAIAAPLPYMTAITNGPPATVIATLADGTTTNRAYSGTSGNYTENDTIAGLPSGSNQNVIVNNGSSGYYFVETPNTAPAGINSIRFALSAPSSGIVTLTEYQNGTATSSSDGTAVASLAFPQWWTQTSLYSDVTTGGNSTALPTGCNAQGSGTFYPFARTTTVVDTVLGYVDTRTVTSYVAQNYANSGTVVGPVCVTISDVEQLYYDYFLDTPYSIYITLTAQPLQTDTISESYWFASPPTGYARVRAQSTDANAIPGLAASIAAREAAIDFRRSVQRTQRIENFARNIAGHTLGGLK